MHVAKLISNLANLVVIHNKNLKRGIINDIIVESNIIFHKYIELIPEFNDIIISDPDFGLNLILTSITGRILFPAFLYRNSYRLLIVKELRIILDKELTFEEFQKFLIKKFYSTFNFKKGGFTDRTLEVLRFYLMYFDKVIDTDAKKFSPYFDDYKYKYIDIGFRAIEKRFSLIQNYSTYYLMPKFWFRVISCCIHHDTTYRNHCGGIPGPSEITNFT